MSLIAHVNPAAAQLRIATYNASGSPNKVNATDAQTLLAAMGNETVSGIARPVDILLLQEQQSAATEVQQWVNELNAIYGAGVYARGVVNGAVLGGSDRQGVVYNTQSVALLGEVAVGSIGSSANARQAMRYQFRPVGYDAASDFYVYNSHYKAGDFASDRNRRHAEAMSTRANADALGAGAHVIYAGDFNIGTNLELMWGALTGPGNGQAIDPTNPTNATQFWGESSAFKHLHTQSPVKTTRYSGQVTGGMDDRFDFQLTSGEFQDDEGLSFIAGSYRGFGNNGTHPLNGELDDPANTALPTATLTAIANESDHIPVVADYQLPAKMQAAVASAPGRVLVGANVPVDVTVANIAPVATTNGADELDFTITTNGDVTGSATDVAPAASLARINAVHLNTATAGAKSGTIDVNSSSQQVMNGSFDDTLTFDVIDHAQPSFNGSTDQDTLTIDFGIIAHNEIANAMTASVHNREAAAGFTSNLDLDAIQSVGDVSRLTIDLQTFTDLAPGNDENFSAMLATDQLGTFSAMYTLSLSDENLPGELTGQTLTINLSGIVALPGDGDTDGDVDTVDLTNAIINFNGAGGSGKGWADGDTDGDGDVDTVDLTRAISSLTGAAGDSIAYQTLQSQSDLSVGVMELVYDTDDGRLFLGEQDAPLSALFVLGSISATEVDVELFGRLMREAEAGDGLSVRIVPEPGTMMAMVFFTLFIHKRTRTRGKYGE